MKTYYSDFTKGFYNTDIHTGFPEDSIEITTEEHLNLLNLQSNGHTIEIVDGIPTAVLRKQSISDLKLQKKKEASSSMDFEANNNEAFITLSVSGISGSGADIDVNARQVDLSNANLLFQKMQMDNLNSITFRCFDNSFTEMSILDIQNLISALINRGLELYQRKWTMGAKIDFCTDEDTEENRTMIMEITF